MNLEKLVFELLTHQKPNKKILANCKRKWAKKHGRLVKNSEILAAYEKLIQKAKIKRQPSLEDWLRLKKVRSLSGIVPVAVMTKPYPCPGQCVYCPTQKAIPKSYLDDEPAVMRAQMAGFDPYLQVQRRLKQLQATGHITEKIELIVLGGTFSVLPHPYQRRFIKRCFDAANGQASPTLAASQKLNETAKNRIVGLTLETRPDQITAREIKWMRQLGATRVEIGVQSIFDDVLKKINRGHTVQATIKATRLLKNAGFKVCYHLMPNLPGSSLKRDYQMFQTVFTDSRFKPDMIKIYPCVVVYQAKLFEWFKKGKFQPYSDQELIDLLIKIKKIVPSWVRINRLGRDIPVANIVSGNKLSNIRQVLQQRLQKKGIVCQCIRCREVRSRAGEARQLKLKIMKYRASGGEEYFLQFIDTRGYIYGLLRLRNDYRIIIRELHVYGQALALKQKDVLAPQHHGLGKRLIKKAEEIARQAGRTKISVIAAIGSREYYRRLGYRLENTDMVKSL